MSKAAIPLGQAENEKLEFKSRDVLKADLTSVGKEVTAFLNRDGGDLWIGLSDRDGRADAIEPIDKPEVASRRVRDFLADTMEPALTDEVSVECVGEVLRVRVTPRPERKPYSLVKGGARHFLIRVGDRNRPMTREELFGPPDERGKDRLQEAIGRVTALRDGARKAGSQRMWMAVLPVGKLEVDIHAAAVKELLLDASRSGNRARGWTFVNHYQRPVLRKGRLVNGEDEEGKRAEIHDDGLIVFSIPLGSLHYRGRPDEFWPYCLVEYPVSVMRLESALLKIAGRPNGDVRILADLAMFGVRGWKLGPHSPDSMAYQFHDHASYDGDVPDLEWTPLDFDYESVVDEPDRCGYRLVRRIYEAFGFDESKIPREFDSTAMRLILPE